MHTQTRKAPARNFDIHLTMPLALPALELGGFGGGVTGKVEITVRINHDGEVNRCVLDLFF